MPIRRHIIDYGDWSEPMRLDGSFKNHRGLTPGGQEICGSDSTDFGLTEDACDSRFLQFYKTYTCTPSFRDTLPRCQSGGRDYPCQDYSGCCVFKPRVQVLDNWGVCNGFCSNSGGGPTVGDADEDLCFNRSTTNFLTESNDPNGPINECTILAPRQDYLFGNQPYTPYEGVVVVCPGPGDCSGFTPWPLGGGGAPCGDGLPSCEGEAQCIEGSCGFSCTVDTDCPGAPSQYCEDGICRWVLS